MNSCARSGTFEAYRPTPLLPCQFALAGQFLLGPGLPRASAHRRLQTFWSAGQNGTTQPEPGARWSFSPNAAAFGLTLYCACTMA